MMTRNQQILAGVLALQILIGLFVFWPRSAPVVTGEPLLSDLQADQVVGLTITDNTGMRLKLERVGAGWVLPEAGSYAADATRVTPVLSKFTAIQTNRLVTQTAASHRRLMVAEDVFERKVELELADGGRVIFFIGSSAGARATHVRLVGQNQVYQTGELTAFDTSASASSWINTDYQTIPAEQITTFIIENANGRLEFEKDDQGAWTMASLGVDENLDATKIETWVGRLASMRMVAPLSSTPETAYGLDEPAAKLTIVTRDEIGGRRTIILSVGAIHTLPDGYVVKSTESAYYVVVSALTVEEFISAARDMVLIPLPETTPEE